MKDKNYGAFTSSVELLHAKYSNDENNQDILDFLLQFSIKLFYISLGNDEYATKRLLFEVGQYFKEYRKFEKELENMVEESKSEQF